MRKDVEGLVFTKRRMLPAFAGLIVVAGLFAFVASAEAVESMKESRYLAAPAVGNLYVVRLAAS